MYLRSLLDLTRIADCAFHEAAAEHRPFSLTEDSMRHSLSASRAYAQLQASLPVAPPCEFRFSITRPGKGETQETYTFPSALDASFEAVALQSTGAVVRFWPVVQQTLDDGQDAYPRPLHRDASAEARIGWKRAATQHHQQVCEQALVRRPSLEQAMWGQA